VNQQAGCKCGSTQRYRVPWSLRLQPLCRRLVGVRRRGHLQTSERRLDSQSLWGDDQPL